MRRYTVVTATPEGYGKDAGVRIRHLIAEYEEDGRAYAEAWVQVDLLDMCWCLWRRRIELRR